MIKTIKPHSEEVVKITCSCGCDDYIQFTRFLDSYRNSDDEELYLLEFKTNTKNWDLKLKLKEFLRLIKNPKHYMTEGKHAYYMDFMLNSEQALRLFNILKDDIENFKEETADSILKGIENFSPLNKKVDEYTIVMKDFNEDLMWIGLDGIELKSIPELNQKEGFHAHDISIGYRLDKSEDRKNLMRGFFFFLRTGYKYYISDYDAILNKEDIISIMGSIKYMLNNTFQKSI